jgi:hypothetical protein
VVDLSRTNVHINSNLNTNNNSRRFWLYRHSSNQAYMSKEANNCTDGLGFISGTGCFNGVRKVLNIASTQQAYQQHVQSIKNNFATKKNDEILTEAIITCNPSTENCQGALAEARI